MRGVIATWPMSQGATVFAVAVAGSMLRLVGRLACSASLRSPRVLVILRRCLCRYDMLAALVRQYETNKYSGFGCRARLLRSGNRLRCPHDRRVRRWSPALVHRGDIREKPTNNRLCLDKPRSRVA